MYWILIAIRIVWHRKACPNLPYWYSAFLSEQDKDGQANAPPDPVNVYFCNGVNYSVMYNWATWLAIRCIEPCLFDDPRY